MSYLSSQGNRTFEHECFPIFLISQPSELNIFIPLSRKTSKISLTNPIPILLSHHIYFHNKCPLLELFCYNLINVSLPLKNGISLRTGNRNFTPYFIPSIMGQIKKDSNRHWMNIGWMNELFKMLQNTE